MHKDKILITCFALTLSIAAIAQDEEDCSEPALTELSKKISKYPTCIKDEKSKKEELRKAMISRDSDGELFRKFCAAENCKPFEILANDEKTADNYPLLEKNRKEFAQATLDGLRKNLGQTLTDLMSLRSSFNTKFDSSEAVTSCNINTQLSKHKCGNGKTLESLLTGIFEKNPFNDLQRDLAYEIEGILTGKSNENALLNRTPASCSISDNQLLFAKRQYLESLITPDFITDLQNVNIDQYVKNQNAKDPKAAKMHAKDVDFYTAATEMLKGSNAEVFKKLQFHPLLKGLLSKGKSRESFLKELSSSFKKTGLKSTPEQLNMALVETLYTDDHAKSLNTEISDRCKNTFKQVREMFCSENFEKGNVAFQNDSEFKTAKGYTLKSIPPSIDFEKANADVVEFCHVNSILTKSPISFTSINDKLCGELPTLLKQMDYKQYRSKAYSSAFGDPENNLCAYEKAGGCNEGQKDCEFYKFWIESKKEGSPQSDLLANHNPNIDVIIGSFIGAKPGMKGNDPLIAPGVDEETKERLRLSGIIPKVDGTREESKSTVSTPKAYNERVRTQSSGGSNVAGGNNNTPPKFKPQDQGKGVAPTASYNNLGPDEETTRSGGSDNEGKSTGSKDTNTITNSGVQNSNEQFNKNFVDKMMKGAGKRRSKMRGGNLREVGDNDSDTIYPQGGSGGSTSGQSVVSGQNFDSTFEDDNYQARLQNNTKKNTGGAAGGSVGGYSDRDGALLKTKYAENTTGGATSGSGDSYRSPADEKTSSSQTVVELPAVDEKLSAADQEKAIYAGLEAQGQLLKSVQETQPNQFNIVINTHKIMVQKGVNGLYTAVPTKGVPQFYVDALNKKLAVLLKRNAEYRGLKGSF